MSIRIRDVTLREFFQNVKSVKSIITNNSLKTTFNAETINFVNEKRFLLYKSLAKSGIKSLEICSLTNPKISPYMSIESLTGFFNLINKDLQRTPNTIEELIILIPPSYKYYTLISENIPSLIPSNKFNKPFITLATYISAVQKHSLYNVNLSIEDTMTNITAIAKDIFSKKNKNDNITFNDLSVCISGAWGWKYNGKYYPPTIKIENIFSELLNNNIFLNRISLSDLQGLSALPIKKTLNIPDVHDVFKNLQRIVSRNFNNKPINIGFHPHTTNQGLLSTFSNIISTLPFISEIDCSLGGVGGCTAGTNNQHPGNIATEIVCDKLSSLGFVKGIDSSGLYNISNTFKTEIYDCFST